MTFGPGDRKQAVILEKAESRFTRTAGAEVFVVGDIVNRRFGRSVQNFRNPAPTLAVIGGQQSWSIAQNRFGGLQFRPSVDQHITGHDAVPISVSASRSAVMA